MVVALAVAFALALALAEAVALALAERAAEALADAVALADAPAEVFADAEVLTEVAVGAGVARSVLVCRVTAACAGTTSAVAGVGELCGEWPLIVIAAATPPGAPTTVPASAATVIAGYFRVQDWLASDRVIGLLRLCLALWLPTVGFQALSFDRLPG